MKRIEKPNSNLKIIEVDISEIKIKRQGLRCNEEPEDLIKSIKEIGLINPPTINQQYELVAGGRRYAALKALGWKKIPVIMYESAKDDRSIYQEELAHIDENLIRLNLNKIETEEALAKRKRIYEHLYPSSKKGGDRKSDKIKGQESSIDSFVADTAKKTGKSESSIKDGLRRSEKSSPALKAARAAKVINATQATELVKLAEQDQEKLIPYLKNKDTKEVKEIVSKVKEAGVDSVIGDIEFSYSGGVCLNDLRKATAALVASLSVLSKHKSVSQDHIRQNAESYLTQIEKSIAEFRIIEQMPSLPVADEA